MQKERRRWYRRRLQGRRFVPSDLCWCCSRWSVTFTAALSLTRRSALLPFTGHCIDFHSLAVPRTWRQTCRRNLKAKSVPSSSPAHLWPSQGQYDFARISLWTKTNNFCVYELVQTSFGYKKSLIPTCSPLYCHLLSFLCRSSLILSPHFIHAGVPLYDSCPWRLFTCNTESDDADYNRSIHKKYALIICWYWRLKLDTHWLLVTQADADAECLTSPTDVLSSPWQGTDSSALVADVLNFSRRLFIFPGAPGLHSFRYASVLVHFPTTHTLLKAFETDVSANPHVPRLRTCNTE